MADEGNSRGATRGLRLIRDDGTTKVVALPGFTKAQKARVRRVREWERRSTENVLGVVVGRKGDLAPEDR